MEDACMYHPDAPLIADSRAGDLVCPECGGVVAERVVDVGAEWRSFSDERGAGADRSRVGAPQRVEDEWAADDATAIAAGVSQSDQSLVAAQRRTLGAVDRQRARALAVIRETCERMNIVRSIQDVAVRLYSSLLKDKTLRRRGVEARAAACVYIACRKERASRSLQEICAASHVSKKEIGKHFTLIMKSLTPNLNQISWTDFMSRFCGNLNLPFSVQVVATHIAATAVELDLVAGRSPISIAAGVIYLASQASHEKRTVKEISEVSGAAVATVKQAYKLLYPKAQLLFPDDFVFHTPLGQIPVS